jgi:nucleotide-binding universal stress UspA family protein
MYKNILAPLDGSKLGECTVAHIKAIATGCQAPKVTLLIVVEPKEILFPEYGSRQAIEETTKKQQALERQSRESAEQYLANIAKDLKKENIDVRTEVLFFNAGQIVDDGVAGQILDFAEKNGIDLIIMSTHGRSGVSRWVMGSVTDKIVRHSKIPVLTVVPAGCRVP